MFDLTGKITLVTGAASGIGEAIAHTFAKNGAFVYVADIDEDSGKRVSAEINDDGGSSEFLKLNLASDSDCQNAGSLVHDKHGRLDILVNNAGICEGNLVFLASPQSGFMFC